MTEQKIHQLEKEHVEVSSIGSRDPKYVHGETVSPRGDYSGASEKTDPAEIALVKKLDRRLIVSTKVGSLFSANISEPILWAMYFLNYLDRNALPQARLNSLEEDLGLEGVQYNTAISILFVGYILMQGKSTATMLYF